MQEKIYKDYIFIFRPRLDVSNKVFDECVEYMNKNVDCAVLAPKIIGSDFEVFDNYRNFPSIIDLIIKNIGFLRKRFPARMRRFLLWDLDMTRVVEVDFVTSDFMCIRKSFYEKSLFWDFKSNFFDLKICLSAWSAGYKVLFNPLVELRTEERKLSRSLGSKFRMMISAFKLLLVDFRKFRTAEYPSKKYRKNKELLLMAHKMNSRSVLSKIGSNFQKQNRVVQVYEGLVEGAFRYKQPLVFQNDGVLAVVKNSKQEYGLIKIWRHCPLNFNIRNLFPVFPDSKDLGMFSLECVRGGAEKHDNDLKLSILRELEEEINLLSSDIVNCTRGSKIIANTAWDVANTQVFIFRVKDDFRVKLQESESIVSFDFYSRKQVLELIKNNQLNCALTRAALLEDILMYD